VLRHLTARGLAVSAEVVALGPGGRILTRFQPDLPLIPASLSKLFVAARALRRWGGRHRFTLAVEKTTPLRDGYLSGPLVLVDSGDPGLVHDNMLRTAWEARALGLTAVQGGLVLVAAGYGRPPCRLADRCRAMRESRHAYAAQPTSLAADYGTIDVLVAPGSASGAPARVAFLPFPPAGIRLVNRVSTVAPANRRPLAIRQRLSHGRESVRVTGAIAVGHRPLRLYVAAAHPDALAAALWAGAFARAGIRIRGQTVIRRHPPPGSTVWFVKRSVTLATLIGRMLAYSNNFIADDLTFDLAREVGGSRPRAPTLPEASRALTRALTPWLARWGARPPVRLESGSGLSRRNRSSAADLIAVLAGMAADGRDFPAFWAALPPAGESPLAFLTAGHPVWRRCFFVKSGTLSDPVSVLGLAGYFRRADGGIGAFAVLVNGTPAHPGFSITPVLAALRRFLTPFAGSGLSAGTGCR
jgi:D-alanyl-D-alanine carboxypeptidase/D-alanyl-D-alanine-endopeptidase (penicillin-binding protein 4)